MTTVERAKLIHELFVRYERDWQRQLRDAYVKYAGAQAMHHEWQRVNELDDGVGGMSVNPHDVEGAEAELRRVTQGAANAREALDYVTEHFLEQISE